jgi:monoamine oxidase
VPLTVRARAAIVTLPAGVLNANALRFDPPLPKSKRDAASCIVMGPVTKLVLRFRSAFWERVADGRYRDGAFFHNAGAAFPTFWTQLPLRAPLLVAWAGGPKADALAALGDDLLVATALDELRALFGAEADPHAEFEAVYFRARSSPRRSTASCSSRARRPRRRAKPAPSPARCSPANAPQPKC